jgi:predicted transcriptional regulator
VPCQMPSQLLTNDISALAMKLDETAHLLAQCAVKHAGAVNAYVAARAEVQRWNDNKEER